jgi:large subunit ribosomal protein L21
MYAIFEDGSRQYKVSEGQLVTVDYREGEPGSRVEFNRVLLYRSGEDFKVGQPIIEGLRVLAEIVDQPSTKLYIQHFRRRKNYRRLRGHRQHYLRLRVKHILLPGQEAPAVESQQAAPPAAPETSTPPAPAATAPTSTETTAPPATI